MMGKASVSFFIWVATLLIFTSSNALAASDVQLQKAYLASSKTKVSLEKRKKNTKEIDVVLDALSYAFEKQSKKKFYKKWDGLKFSAQDYSGVLDVYAKKVVRTANVKAVIDALNETLTDLENSDEKTASGGAAVNTSDCLNKGEPSVLNSSAREALLSTGWVKRLINSIKSGLHISSRKKARTAEVPVAGSSSSSSKASSGSSSSSKASSDSSSSPKSVIGSGLKNLGNTCFANATHQLWYYSPVLRRILNQEYPQQYRRPEVEALRANLRSLLVRMDQKKADDAEGELRALYRQFNKVGGAFHINIGNQEDASEYMFALLDQLSYGTYNPIRIQKNYLFEDETETVPGSKLDENSHLIISVAGSEFKNVAGGVEQALAAEEMKGAEKIEDPRDGRKKNGHIFQHLLVPDSGPPDELLVQVNRNDNYGQKVQREIDSFGPISPDFQTSESRPLPKRPSYVPYEFVVHDGRTPHDGHYFTITHDLSTGKWWEHNDRDVFELTGTKLQKRKDYINRNAVMINYKKVP